MDRKDREEISEFKNAAKECDAERAQSQAAFEARWGGPEGTNRNDAFGKCVSANARED